MSQSPSRRTGDRPVRLFDLHPSPNSKKVRLALGLKGIEHELVPVDPADRQALVALSGQPLAPVLQHGDTVVFDSGAILRYLEVNVRREPRLYSADPDVMREIEGWELWARTELAPRVVGPLFGTFFAEREDESVVEAARAAYAETTERVEEALGDGLALVGEHVTAADLQVASFLGLGMLSAEQAGAHAVLAHFHERLRLPEGRDRVSAWYRAIDRWDT